MSETITADHLNATHLGERITINSLHGTVVSGKLKKISADYAIMPDFVSYGPCEEYMAKPLRYRKTFTSSCTCRTKPTTISKQSYTRTRNYR